MVAESKITEILNSIAKIKWFRNIGKPLRNSNNLVIAPDKKQAIAYWLSFELEEASSVAWEAFRYELVQNDNLYLVWEKKFEACVSLLHKSIKKSEIAQDLMSLSKQTVEEFCSKLPFLGAIGELLVSDIKPEYNFHLSQISFYQQGHWICGWKGELHNDRFVYPGKQFVIY